MCPQTEAVISEITSRHTVHLTCLSKSEGKLSLLELFDADAFDSGVVFSLSAEAAAGVVAVVDTGVDVVVVVVAELIT